MAIPNSNITENYDAFKILRESQLNTAMDYIDTQFNTYTKNNFIQIAKDVFGNSYDYDNDGNAQFGTPLTDLAAKLADNETVTGSWTFSSTVAHSAAVTSTSTFTSSGQMRCKAFLDSAVQAIPDATLTAINFNNEVYDVGSMHDNAVNNNRIIIPGGGAGLYSFTGQVEFAANATGKREVYIYKNGSSLAKAKEISSSAGETTFIQIKVDDVSSDTDYYELRVYQNSGGALNINNGNNLTFFSCMKVW